MSYTKKTAEQIVIDTDPMREGWGLDMEERIAAALLAAEKRGLERAAMVLADIAKIDAVVGDLRGAERFARLAARIRALPVSAPEGEDDHA